MGKYGYSALLATKLFRDGKASSPNAAWEMAVATIFPDSKSSQEKGCPRDAYLGLCESGSVAGIPKGNYCRSAKNKGYALKALSLLIQNPTIPHSEETLWDQVMEGEHKTPNHQMDVVISLWKEGFIEAFEEYPAACRGDEFMPFRGGYKGDRKVPLIRIGPCSLIC